MVLLILALIWAVVLIPPAIRNRAEARPADSISAFRHQLAVLDRTGPRTGGVPRSRPRSSSPTSPAQRAPLASRPAHATARSDARRRRKDVLTALLVAAGATLVLGAVPALRVIWLVHVAVDVLLVAYVALLVHQRNLAAERSMKVRFLPGPRPIDDRAWSRSDSAWLAN